MFKRRFSLLGKYFAIQFCAGRPRFLYKYNDGYTSFVDLGPLRVYRHFYKEKNFVEPNRLTIK